MMRLNRRGILAAVLVGGVALVASLASPPAGAADWPPPLGKKTIVYAHGPWSTTAVVYVAKEMLERIGYKVEPKQLDTGLAYQALATGNADVWSNAYLPGQQSYIDKHAGKVEILSVSYAPVPGGLMVPAYAPANTIEDLKKPDVRAAFGGKIVAVDAGAGVTLQAERAVKTYGLDFEVLPSGSAAMTAAFKSAYEKHQPIIVTGWCPHYLCALYDVKFLKDDKGIYGYSQDYHVVRAGFRHDFPRATVLLSRLTLVQSKVSEMLVWMEREGIDYKAAAARFVEQNPDLVWYWIGDLVPGVKKPFK